MFVFKYFNICVIVCSESDHFNKKQLIILTVASKHFGHVTFYAADEESGSTRQESRKKFYARKKVIPFILNPPLVFWKLGKTSETQYISPLFILCSKTTAIDTVRRAEWNYGIMTNVL